MSSLCTLFVSFQPCYGYDLCLYTVVHMHACACFSSLCVCVCMPAGAACSTVCLYIPAHSMCTAALRPASPEAKECPLFLLLLLPAPLTLLAHALSGAAGTSAQPRPSRPAGRVGRMNPSTLTWTGTRSGSWERIHNGKMRGRAEEERSQRAFTSFFTKISEGSPAYS